MHTSYPVFKTDPDGDTLGGRISRAREAAGLTVKETATRLGVKKDTVSAWERDRSEPRANRLYMLAGILGVSAVWLMSGAGEGGPGEAAPVNSDALKTGLIELQRLNAETGRAIEALQRALSASAAANR